MPDLREPPHDYPRFETSARIYRTKVFGRSFFTAIPCFLAFLVDWSLGGTNEVVPFDDVFVNASTKLTRPLKRPRRPVPAFCVSPNFSVG